MGPLMLDVSSYELDAEEREIIQHPTVGGIIFFARNYDNRDQLRALIKDIRQTAKRPLIIGVDQEGGRVQRFREQFTLLPPARAFAESNNGLALATTGGWLMAAELLAMDIDISFAPVLDLGFDCKAIGDRAFSDNPAEVIRYASAFIDGMTTAGMAATGKHFPGHGGVIADSHLETPYDSRDNIKQYDMTVFSHLISKNKLQGIMPAHVVFDAYDERPASGSEYWLKQVLRQDLGFNGVIFSDDLNMKGADVLGNYSERAVAAQQSGCDMVMLCNNRAGAIQALDGLPQTQVPILNTLLKQPTPEFNVLMQTREWKQAQQTISGLVDKWNNKTN
ncbi:beta-hexosaminidase [Photobacterium kishitanii]|uniref:Beta-hexosaminidase n=1 Tax=Photobacterium kishitanii TaxID=318456 RepID=A0AAX0Z1F6_9GAMM|nr:beta-N-acetylhexosaminidase [Photobacterium kishitanii]KJG10795.1 beta-hexosaminidase [Photobacterium kishitanii]KJG59800.1 beta-hexosaminidase [Photobacterium kishitanii]KJG63085.1 beta-hexosaminidase [Photobacterium kishitanii]KJG67900.1 beta-hexosaminidase [Photobacterium kishitanii]KJG71260.1 beta-hexosaminidase [Photobacterium kishitanii]